MVPPFSLDIPNEIPVTIVENAATLAKNVQLHVLRLDLMHSFVSGNKLYKLHFFLKEAIVAKINSIVTFGGAYSNHLPATAFACNSLGLESYGIVRGEQPADLSPTLLFCQENNMHLIFVSRKEYRQPANHELIKDLPEKYILVPEGGFAPQGAEGAALIMKNDFCKKASHVITATGTATTLAGLCLAAEATQKIIGIPVLKNMLDIEDRISFLLTGNKYLRPKIFSEYHFGGYAKKTNELINFMNWLYNLHELPTDFVYTAKMMFGILDQIEKNYFPPGSSIIALHTGGLQGNNSLPSGTLIF